MINVLIPSMGHSLFFQDSYFPKPMMEIMGKTMLEQVVENYSTLKDKHFIFVFDQKDCAEFHLDESVRVLTRQEADTLILENQTAGALCTCLMAIEYVNNDAPLLIANCDQILDVDYEDVYGKFCSRDEDAGVITFDSIHPRWSYAKIKEGQVVEVAEKRPFSKHAIAGFYYFKHGSDFVSAAQNAILKDSCLNGLFYISSSLNEIILSGKKVGHYEITRDRYHSFYSPQKIQDYEDMMRGGRREDS